MDKECKICHEIFDQDIKPIWCPHLEFKKPCKLHKRLNCGNLECETENKTLEFPKLEKVRKNASNNN